MTYFFLDQLLYPSDSGSESQRGRKRCGGGGPDWCDKKRGMRRAHWEAHFGAHGGLHGHGPHGGPPHGPPHGGPHGGHGTWGHHHHHHGGRHWGVPADRGLPIDFLERDSGFEILADIPGVEKSDIKLSVEGDVLSIKVENKEAPAPETAGAAAADDGDFAMVGAEGEHGPSTGTDGGEGANDSGEGASGSADVKYHQHERSTDFPARAVRFPDTADLSNVKASYVNGVLKLEVPKLPAKEPQQIAIA